MWRAEKERPYSHCQKFRLLGNHRALSYGDVLLLWEGDVAFRAWFNGLIADSEFAAFQWETPCVTAASLNQPFQFVLLRNDALDRPVDERTFSGHFSPEHETVTFPNLGSDAILVAPCPRDTNHIYGHLASFVRGADESQQHALWQAVAAAMQHRVGERPVWLSTAGMGVAWLHVRLDDHPKYYGYAPFRKTAIPQ